MMEGKKDFKHKTFNLDDDTILSLKEGSKLNSMNQSEFIRFLAQSWGEAIDPSKKLKKIQKEKKYLKEQLISLEEQEEKMIGILQKKDEWNSKRRERKPKIISNLMRIISEGRYSDAEVIAKNQSISLGIPAIELLSEASSKLGDGQ